jgi:phosphoribosylformylglycinamidine cyclo-ligase
MDEHQAIDGNSAAGAVLRDRYAEAGVDYERLDAAKRLAGELAAGTGTLLAGHGAAEVSASRGQPAFVFRTGGVTLATVLECLGTKSLLADDLLRSTGEDRWADVARDTVAAVVNDLASVGALPLVVHAYFATGSARFYDHPTAFSSLAHGWRAACEAAGATWGGGETPTLAGLVTERGVELAGSAVGMVPQGREPILGQGLAAGDEIVLVDSSGLHANGASLVRRVAAGIDGGLAHPLPSGRSLGEAALDPSVIYVRLVGALLDADVPVTYLSNITGHGLRKVMRAQRELSYVLTELPPVPEVLDAVSAAAGLSTAEAYATFNMGAGFAVMCRPGEGARVVEVAAAEGYTARLAGTVEAGPRRVVLAPLDVVYGGESLQLG